MIKCRSKKRKHRFYYYVVSVMTKELNPQGILGVMSYQCVNLPAAKYLDKILRFKFSDAKINIFKVPLLVQSDLIDNIPCYSPVDIQIEF